jgi:DNA-binding response OmpR family regulator
MKRVLVVEHDRLHGDLIREWLEQGGAQGFCADSLDAAPAGIDAILIDVASQQQAHAVLRSWRCAYPHAAMVAASGRFSPGDTANDAMARRLGVTRILAKPFTRGDLWAALDLQAGPSTLRSARRS